MPVVTVIIKPWRTSQVGATHLMVSLTPADAPTHLLPRHAGVGAGVVGLATNVLAVLVGVITSRPHRGVTGRGHRHIPTATADSISGAAFTRVKAAVLISVERIKPFRSAGTVTQEALIPTLDLETSVSVHPPIVVAGVRVGGALTCSHSSQHQQQQDDGGQDPHIQYFFLNKLIFCTLNSSFVKTILTHLIAKC